MSAFSSTTQQPDQYYSEQFAAGPFDSQGRWVASHYATTAQGMQHFSESCLGSGSTFQPVTIQAGPVHYAPAPSSLSPPSHHIQYTDNQCQHPVYWVPDAWNGSPAIAPSSPASSSSSFSPASYYATTLPRSSPPPSPSPSSPSPPPFTGPIRNRRPHTKAKKAERIPRPRNAFILFRSHFYETNPPQVSPTGKRINQNELSKEVGRVWRAMSKEEQQPWKDKYAEELELHKLKYPNYAFEPKRKAEGRKPRRDRKAVESVSVSSGSESESGASVTSFAYPSPASSLSALSPAPSIPFCFPGEQEDGVVGGVKQPIQPTDNERPSTLNTALDILMGAFNLNDAELQFDMDALQEQLATFPILFEPEAPAHPLPQEAHDQPSTAEFDFNFDFSDMPAPSSGLFDEYDALFQQCIDIDALNAA